MQMVPSLLELELYSFTQFDRNSEDSCKNEQKLKALARVEMEPFASWMSRKQTTSQEIQTPRRLTLYKNQFPLLVTWRFSRKTSFDNGNFYKKKKWLIGSRSMFRAKIVESIKHLFMSFVGK